MGNAMTYHTSTLVVPRDRVPTNHKTGHVMPAPIGSGIETIGCLGLLVQPHRR